MTQVAPAVFKIPTKSPQPARGKPAGPAARAKAGRVLVNGAGRTATRGGGEVVELEYGITVYLAPSEGGRWRAVWHEDGLRQQCEAASEEKLAGKLEKVTVRLAADAPKMKRPGADLIAWYLNPDRLPVDERWSRKHAHTQRRLCERFVSPVIDEVTCQDIMARHMQQIVNAASTPGEGNRVQGTVSALVSAGLDGGYLVAYLSAIDPLMFEIAMDAADLIVGEAPRDEAAANDEAVPVCRRCCAQAGIFPEHGLDWQHFHPPR